MTSVTRSIYHLGGASSLWLATSALTPAAAQEYCIACTKPDAVYRCVIDKAVPTGKPLKWLCLGALARQGGHADCHVRKGTVFDCDGPIRRIDAKAAAAALETAPVATGPVPTAPALPAANRPSPPSQQSGAARADNPAAQVPTEPAADKATKPASASPRTVEEVARNMSKSSGETLGKAGDSIANTTRKAWGCVTSFFKSC